MLSRAPRIVTWVVAFLVGAVYGLAGTIAHSYRLGWFPLGLVLAIIGSAALLAAVRLLTADRWAALATGTGMIVATLVFSGKGPGGSSSWPRPAWQWCGPCLCPSSWCSPSPGRTGCGPSAPTRRPLAN